MKGKRAPLSDLKSCHPALAPGDAPHVLLLHAAPADPGLTLEEEASDGLGKAGKVLLEVGQLGGVDLVLAVLVVLPLRLGLLYSNFWCNGPIATSVLVLVLILA